MNEAVATIAGDRKWKAVYTIVERHGSASNGGDRQGSPERKFWVRVGTAFVNRDQSLNVHLDAAPTNGALALTHVDDIVLEVTHEARPIGGTSSLSADLSCLQQVL